MSWVCLIPPIVVLTCALWTKRVVLSLCIGLITASWIAKDFHPLLGATYATQTVAENLNLTDLFYTFSIPSDSNWTIFSFLIALGSIVIMLQESGATQAFGSLIQARVKKRKDVESISLILSIFFFIDDYFSSLSIGSLMHPITDQYRIARAKLAFLIDSMAAPLAILCPFSTWVGAVIGFLGSNGVSMDLSTNPLIQASPLSVFMGLIPYIFYSFIIMASAWFIVRQELSFGLMAEAELHALKTGDTLGNPSKERNCPSLQKQSAQVYDFFLIWLVLIGSVLGSMLFHGSWTGFGGELSFMRAFQNSEVTLALFTAGLISSSFCFIYLVARQILSLSSFFKTAWEGTLLMRQAIIILVLAWSMGQILRSDLKIGEYLAENLLSSVSQSFFPFAVFLVSALIAFSTGSAWGTSALLFPIVVPTLVALAKVQVPAQLESMPMFLPTVGALLSGCIAGDHISPISDTTIMTSISTNMRHIDHVKTQLCYAVPVLISTGFAYGCLGFFSELPDFWRVSTSLTFGIFFSLASLWGMQKIFGKNDSIPKESLIEKAMAT